MSTLTSIEERDRLDQFVHHAKTASQCSLVVLSRFDPETQVVRPVAWAGLDSGIAFVALLAVQRVLPNFHTVDLEYRADVNSFTRALYLAGKPVSGAMTELARGIVDERILKIARTIIGTWHAASWPLKADSQVVGALNFESRSAPTPARSQICALLARDAESLLAALKAAT